MAFDPDLADQIRDALAAEPDITERKMFGGLAFLWRGHMAIVASGKGGLMVRTDPDHSDELLATTRAVPVEMRGREMKGWLRLPSADVNTDEALQPWIDRALAFVATLPPK